MKEMIKSIFYIQIMKSLKCLSEDDASIKAKSEILQAPAKKELRPRNNLIPGMFNEQKRAYIKVPQEAKEQLFQLVFKKGFKIKEAAQKLFIKYATAKTIIFHMRKINQKQKNKRCKFCRYVPLKGNISFKLRIISIIQKNLISSVEYIVENKSLHLTDQPQHK
ncbi:unnamed protein product [Paramecium sonneborni]|uniref:Uncharacterized protein n=1 Tax=Paramecium sonneborni TaxID=65129 RepID=A0A8S1R8D1_9CILI|nr:unnamed protein product [Paramecium sonneborni]